MTRWNMIACALALAAGPCLGHDQWVSVEPAYPEAGASGRVFLRSGHAFPLGEMALAQRLLHAPEALGPDSVARPFVPISGERDWSAPVTFDRPGVWFVSFALQRPQTDDPIFVGRSLVVVGGRDEPDRYAANRGLEVVPGAAVSELKPGDELPLTIRLNGTPIAGRIAVTAAKGSVTMLSTAADRPARLKISRAGPYLLTVTRGGKTFALTFTVREREATTTP